MRDMGNCAPRRERDIMRRRECFAASDGQFANSRSPDRRRRAQDDERHFAGRAHLRFHGGLWLSSGHVEGELDATLSGGRKSVSG